MTSRLSTVATDLAQQLEQLPAEQLRRVATEAAIFAVPQTHLTNPIINAAVSALQERPTGDQALRADIDRIVGDLDEIAWNTQAQAEAGDLDDQEYLRAFGRARAAAAVSFALEADALQAALEAVYEAQAAVGDLASLRSMVKPPASPVTDPKHGLADST